MDSRRGLGQKEILDEKSPPPELRTHPGAVRKVPETEGQVHRPSDIREQCETRRQNPRRDHPRQGLQEILQGAAHKTNPDRNRNHRPEHRLAQRRPSKTQGDAQGKDQGDEEGINAPPYTDERAPGKSFFIWAIVSSACCVKTPLSHVVIKISSLK